MVNSQIWSPDNVIGGGFLSDQGARFLPPSRLLTVENRHGCMISYTHIHSFISTSLRRSSERLTSSLPANWKFLLGRVRQPLDARHYRSEKATTNPLWWHLHHQLRCLFSNVYYILYKHCSKFSGPLGEQRRAWSHGCLFNQVCLVCGASHPSVLHLSLWPLLLHLSLQHANGSLLLQDGICRRSGDVRYCRLQGLSTAPKRREGSAKWPQGRCWWWECTVFG